MCTMQGFLCAACAGGEWRWCLAGKPTGGSIFTLQNGRLFRSHGEKKNKKLWRVADVLWTPGGGATAGTINSILLLVYNRINAGKSLLRDSECTELGKVDSSLRSWKHFVSHSVSSVLKHLKDHQNKCSCPNSTCSTVRWPSQTHLLDICQWRISFIQLLVRYSKLFKGF